jgi:maltooligosyltrehalose trehalohydrolase
MMQFGALPQRDGVRFQVWAPEARTLDLLTRTGDAPAIERVLHRDATGIWSGSFADVTAGDRYAYRLDGRDPRPDPASRYQPDGVHGWSEVIDPSSFDWTDDAWAGIERERAVIYELHVGAFSGNGTFRDAASRLEYLCDLGVTVIELMPLADFPGRRDWGYDGAALFAPSRAYGRPEDLRALIDRAHALGVAVIIDVVYNHLGPEGAYLPGFAPAFLGSKHHTPWGPAVNLDDEGSAIVREFLIANALHWVREYHADGLRLDATHALIDTSPRHFVAELTAAVRAATDRPLLVYAEDASNDAVMVRPAASGGWDLDGIWADDFHHVVRRAVAGDAHGYYRDYAGTIGELVETVSQGWLYTGQYSQHLQRPRGTDPADVALERCVICIQNHDQIGNRALGDRLHHTVDAAVWRAAVTLLLTAPMTPLLFMGQEWAASAPFLFFTDFEPSLGPLVAEGRRREFRHLPEFATDEGARSIPDPQDEATFNASRLDWAERREPPHAESLALHRALLRLRASRRALQGSASTSCEARALDGDTIAVRRTARGDTSDMLIVTRIRGGGAVRLDAGPTRPVLTTEDPEFAADPQPIALDTVSGRISFRRPGAVVLEVPAMFPERG